ncbi:hypothetical protein Tco_0090948 [Tanacetum coccineum]
MSSSNIPTSNIEDAYSSNFPNYISASPNYVLTSPGKTYSSSSNSFGVVPIASQTLSLFQDDSYSNQSFSSTSAVPQIFEMGESSRKTSLECHEEQIEDILNHLDELSLGRAPVFVFDYYDESPISWSTQKQATVALSSCESEFIVATATATQALWLKRLLSKLTHSEEEKVTIRVDNKSAIALMKNPVFHGRSKHIDTKYHFITECVERVDVQVEFVSGEYQKESRHTYKITPEDQVLNHDKTTFGNRSAVERG